MACRGAAGGTTTWLWLPGRAVAKKTERIPRKAWPPPRWTEDLSGPGKTELKYRPWTAWVPCSRLEKRCKRQTPETVGHHLLEMD